ncbi:helix-turn-helix transcriptional regulator [Streptomyces sp. Wb2n-11]|uniref:helix-turn-helix domain-containing protein n=1 Tax=Streptomyces sp. Wb2n-11 TaxID=1030533 RepID=UPI000AA36235|nr:helix-turn-helix transcriptional regulator [Streptomyces sp. Wb2n-11]
MTALARALVGPSPSGGGPVPSLTDRELELLQRVADGTTYVQLAEEWVLAEVSVRSIGARVLRKLGAATIAHAVYLACQADLLDGRPRRHGDHAGFRAHERRGEDPWLCPPCAQGERAYRAARKAPARQLSDAA